jgi:hypothetical protein
MTLNPVATVASYGPDDKRASKDEKTHTRSCDGRTELSKDSGVSSLAKFGFFDSLVEPVLNFVFEA